jgi:hypothetical protein
MRRAVFGLAILLTAVCACSESEKCRGELADVGALCPATYDGTAALPDCPDGFRRQEAFRCGDLVALVWGGGGQAECHYDMSSHQLVGAVRRDGISCDGTNFDVTAGHVATSCEAEPFAEALCVSQP